MEPIFTYRTTRWPFQLALAQQLDREQRKRCEAFLQVWKELWETPEQYVRRRRRKAASSPHEHGKRTNILAKLVVSWDEDLLRERNSASWAAKIWEVLTSLYSLHAKF